MRGRRPRTCPRCALGAQIEVVTPSDPSVDLLTARLERVVQIVGSLPDAFWPNQYANLANARAHELGTKAEIHEALDGRVDALVVAVISTGTLGGCIDHIAARGLHTEVVAVDALGSVLFEGTAGLRVIPGLGAGRAPALSFGCHPDRVVRVSDLDSVVGCRRVAQTDAVLVGGSAGGVLHAVRRRQHELAGATVVAIAADSRSRWRRCPSTSTRRESQALRKQAAIRPVVNRAAPRADAGNGTKPTDRFTTTVQPPLAHPKSSTRAGRFEPSTRSR